MSIDYQTLLTLSPNPYVVFDHAQTIVWMNDAYLRTTMREREAITGLPLLEAFPSEPGTVSHDLLQGSIRRVLDTGAADELALIPYAIAEPDGAMEERFWSATHTPLLDDQGQVAYVLQHTVDVTELQSLRQLRDEVGVVQRANAVQSRNTDLLVQSERLRSLFEQAPGFMVVLSGPEHEFQLANAAYRRLVGNREIVGHPLQEVLPEMVEQGFVEILDTVRASGEPYIGRGERVVIAAPEVDRPDERFLDFIYQPIVNQDGGVGGVFVQGHDVTEERTLVRRQELLINELNHRVKNTLAIVQGLASQTFRAIDPSGEARRTFDARLQALAAAHDLLTDRNWEATSLGETIRMAMTAAIGNDARTSHVGGPEVMLAPQHAVAMAMAIHELSTNALKYGALSTASGQVSVTWRRAYDNDEAERLVIEWIEQGGPPVVAPQRKGFGTRLIERGLSAELDGSASIDFDPRGVRCRITLTLPQMTPG